jgi:hypothetical protein
VAHGTGNESNTIRIGVQGTQSATYIAGIDSTAVSSMNPVCISSGQLGVCSSSARYKRDIRDMGSASAGLMKLRPVSFHYKNDPSGTLEYGLLAEEVKRVYPTLVTYGPDGKLQSVRYLEFTALLLNELQKQSRETQELSQRLQTKDQQLAAQQRQLAAQQREIDGLKQHNASINALSQRLAVLERQIPIANTMPLGSLAQR